MARIVFDLDGTLIDSAPDIQGIANRILQAEGRDPIDLATTHKFIGNGTKVFIDRMIAARDLDEADHDRLHAAFLAHYDDAVDLTHPYPGVVAALDALARDHALGICTNKPIKPTRHVVDHLGWSARFGVVYGGDSFAVKKPDPAPLHAAFAALGDGPCLYVGDSEVDAETADRAGVPFLLFTEGYRRGPVADMPHSIAFDDWRAVPDLVARMLAPA